MNTIHLPIHLFGENLCFASKNCWWTFWMWEIFFSKIETSEIFLFLIYFLNVLGNKCSYNSTVIEINFSWFFWSQSHIRKFPIQNEALRSNSLIQYPEWHLYLRCRLEPICHKPRIIFLNNFLSLADTIISEALWRK